MQGPLDTVNAMMGTGVGRSGASDAPAMHEVPGNDPIPVEVPQPSPAPIEVPQTDPNPPQDPVPHQSPQGELSGVARLFMLRLQERGHGGNNTGNPGA